MAFRFFTCAEEKTSVEQLAAPLEYESWPLDMAVLPSKFNNDNPPKRIIVFDVDGTLLNLRTLEIRFKRDIQDIIRQAYENDIMIAVSTARELKLEKDIGYEGTVTRVIDELGRKYFSFAFFTNYNTGDHGYKHLPLKYLHSLFPQLQPSDIVQVDDNPKCRHICHEAGFFTVNALGYYVDRFQPLREYIDEAVRETSKRTSCCIL